MVLVFQITAPYVTLRSPQRNNSKAIVFSSRCDNGNMSQELLGHLSSTTGKKRTRSERMSTFPPLLLKFSKSLEKILISDEDKWFMMNNEESVSDFEFLAVLVILISVSKLPSNSIHLSIFVINDGPTWQYHQLNNHNLEN